VKLGALGDAGVDLVVLSLLSVDDQPDIPFAREALCPPELWRKGEDVHGSKNRQEDLQKLANQEARLTLGVFRTQLGIRTPAAPAHLDNRLRLASLPKGDQARELIGTPSALGQRYSHSSDAGTEEKIQSSSR